MPQFQNKKISLNSENLAEQLFLARQEKKKSLKEISQELNINIKYLRALEKADFRILPEGLYGQNFLKEYTDYLGLNTKEILELYLSEKTNKKNEKLFVQKTTKPHYFLSIPKLFKNLIIIFAVILCLVYIGYYINNIISPPEMTIYYPKEDIITKEHTINIQGKTEETAEVEINGQKILLEKGGAFNLAINLKKGVNTITIVSQKKYSKKNIIKKQIILKP